MMKTAIFTSLALLTLLPGCATLTGIPGHGGGKRFAEEQRLVSSAIRLSIRHIDVSALRSKNAAIVFGLIADEGGGNIVGGRASITAVLTQGAVNVPMSQTRNSVDIFQVASGSTSTSSSTGSETTSATSTVNSSQSTAGSSTQTSTSTSTATTTSEFSSDANQSTVTETSSTTGSSNSGTSSGTSETTNAGTNTTSNSQSATSSGTSETALVTGSETSASGRQSERNLGVSYEGLGQYQNLAVPKSDAAFLMSELRNHFLLNGVKVRSPADPAAEVFVYVSVPILGTNRSRTDLLVYNQESLRAEAYIEVFAVDRSGRVIMPPQVGNFETHYKEDYVAWSGPYNRRRGAGTAAGLINQMGESDAR